MKPKIDKVYFEHFTYSYSANALWKEDEKIEIRHKLHQLLSFFLSNPERVVSKQELLESLWEHGEYRERALSQSIVELRRVLGDQASDPRFIRTVPNRGYQWIAPISTASKDQQSIMKWATVSSLFALMALLGWWMIKPTESLTYQDNEDLTIGVASFENLTGLSGMRWVEFGLSDMLASDLEQFAGLNVVKPSLLQGDDADPTSAIKQNALDVLINASIAYQSGEQVMEYQIFTPDGRSIKGSFNAEDLAFSIPQVANQIHRQLRPDSGQDDLADHQWQINSMHEYAKGQQALVDYGCELAQHYFAASVVLDSTHYWSLLHHSLCQIELGQFDNARQNLSILGQVGSKELNSLTQVALAQILLKEGSLELAETTLMQSEYRTVLAKSSVWVQWGNQIQAQIALKKAETL